MGINGMQSQSIPVFKEGERVAFVGNSITCGGHYHSYIWSVSYTHLFLNQLICDTPSILKSNFPFSSSLMEQTARWVSKLWLNSEECSLPFMGTSLNVHNLRIIS